MFQGAVGFEIRTYLRSLNSDWGSFGVGEMKQTQSSTCALGPTLLLPLATGYFGERGHNSLCLGFFIYKMGQIYLPFCPFHWIIKSIKKIMYLLKALCKYNYM